MKSNIIIILLFALCFGFKAQAQIDKIISLEEMKESAAWEPLAKMLYAPSSRLVFANESEPTHVWPEDGAVKVVDVQNAKSFDLLKSSVYAKAIGTAEILLINVDLKEVKGTVLKSEHLTAFSKLRYIVIRSYEKLDENRVRDLFADLIAREGDARSIQVVYVTLEEAS